MSTHHTLEMKEMNDSMMNDIAMADEEELEETPPGPSVSEFGLSIILIILVFGFLASIWGVVLNLRQYDDVAGVSDDKYAPGPGSFINLFWTSAAVALPVLMARSALRVYSHRHYHQAFCFVTYVALVALIQHEVYTFQPSLREGGHRLQSTLEKMLYTASISSTYSDVSGVSFSSLRDCHDFYSWVRGPLKQFVFGPTKLANPTSSTFSSIQKQMPMWATNAQTISAAAGVTYSNLQLQAVSVRQLRVRPIACPPGLGSATSKCTGPYTKDDETPTLRTMGQMWPVQTEVYAPREYTNFNGDSVMVENIPGQFSWYPADSGHRSVKVDANTGSGYLVRGGLPNGTTYDAMVSSMEANNWWDGLTRYTRF